MEIVCEKLGCKIAITIDGVSIPYVTDYKAISSARNGTELILKIKIPIEGSYQAVKLSAKKATYQRQRRTARNGAP